MTSWLVLKLVESEWICRYCTHPWVLRKGYNPTIHLLFLQGSWCKFFKLKLENMMPSSRMGTGVVSLWLRGYISQHQCEQCGLTVKSCWYNISKQISGIWVFCTNRSLWKGICPGVLHTKHFVLKNALKYSWSLFTSSWLHGCTTKGYKNMLWLKNSLLIGMVENK